MCLNLAVKHILLFPGDMVFICSDSLSSLFVLINVRSFETLVVEIQNIAITNNDCNVNLNFTHVRGQSGVIGNETAKVSACLQLPWNVSRPYSLPTVSH